MIIVMSPIGSRSENIWCIDLLMKVSAIKEVIGKDLEDFRLRKIAKAIKLKPSLLIKFKFIEEQASKAPKSSKYTCVKI